jgi:hypothetical protein
MTEVQAKTVGKTPVMAFVLDYLREFPGAGYDLVKAAAQAAGFGVPATIIYGNALRVLKKETERAHLPEGALVPRSRGRRARAVQDLAGFVEDLEAAVAERDRLRDALDQIRQVIKQLKR